MNVNRMMWLLRLLEEDRILNIAARVLSQAADIAAERMTYPWWRWTTYLACGIAARNIAQLATGKKPEGPIDG